LTGPQSGHEHVTFSGRLQRDQVLHDSGVLHSSTTLLKEYSVVVWYLKELSDLVFSRLRDVSKFVLSVRKFHNTLATAFVVEHFLLAFVEDSFRKNTRPSWEVVSVSVISILMSCVTKTVDVVVSVNLLRLH
jgi:hypothetical protein